jgi:hypothetical protein
MIPVLRSPNPSQPREPMGAKRIGLLTVGFTCALRLRAASAAPRHRDKQLSVVDRGKVIRPERYFPPAYIFVSR